MQCEATAACKRRSLVDPSSIRDDYPVPAVFTAKDPWRTFADGPDRMVLRDNYVSAKEHAAEVQKQFEIEAELGAMYETDLDVACRELGEVSVASLGAIEKKAG